MISEKMKQEYFAKSKFRFSADPGLGACASSGCARGAEQCVDIVRVARRAASSFSDRCDQRLRLAARDAAL
ncbi:hypothetical protein [Bradyrhizobium sp. HKCCYLRH1030]|uniref:hypothetical protein n=1 Tax=Bradyrhizobium sp. HKCCYLRH1030 TaxID=3420744 RepID=UPI003EB8D944